MKNFWKSQWLILVVGFIWLTAAIIYAILGYGLQSALFFVAAWVTFLVARISQLEKRIKEQEAHQKALAKLVEAVMVDYPDCVIKSIETNQTHFIILVETPDGKEHKIYIPCEE